MHCSWGFLHVAGLAPCFSSRRNGFPTAQERLSPRRCTRWLPAFIFLSVAFQGSHNLPPGFLPTCLPPSPDVLHPSSPAGPPAFPRAFVFPSLCSGCLSSASYLGWLLLVNISLQTRFPQKDLSWLHTLYSCFYAKLFFFTVLCFILLIDYLIVSKMISFICVLFPYLLSVLNLWEQTLLCFISASLLSRKGHGLYLVLSKHMWKNE